MSIKLPSILHNFITTENSVVILRDLLTLRENPNSPDVSGKTPLHTVITKRERSPEERDELLAMASELISFGANVNQGDYNGSTPLHFATIARDYKVIKLLLEANADINKRDRFGLAALHYATSKSAVRRDENLHAGHDTVPSVVKLLLRYNPDVNILNFADETPLMCAILDDNLHNVRALLNKNASVDLQNAYGETALYLALYRLKVNVNIVFELFRKGSSFNIANDNGISPREAYFQRLDENQPAAEVEKAKQVIKICMLKYKKFNAFEEQCITKANTAHRDKKLRQYLNSCYEEIGKMKKDTLAPGCSVFNVAVRDVYCLNFETNLNFASQHFDSVMDRLISLRYPYYREVIASSISRSYLTRKFAEMCSNRHSGIGIFDFDELIVIAKYLSNLEMINMITACKRIERRPSALSCFIFWLRFPL